MWVRVPSPLLWRVSLTGKAVVPKTTVGVKTIEGSSPSPSFKLQRASLIGKAAVLKTVEVTLIRVRVPGPLPQDKCADVAQSGRRAKFRA